MKLRPSSALRRWDFTVDRLPWWRRLTPPQLFVTSFASLILAGTIGLQNLPGLYTGDPLTWEESLFTATSAVCVTGLNVTDPATRLTTTGQAYILLLIQLGGLGMIVFTSLIILALGGRLSLRTQSMASTSTGAETGSFVEPRRLVFDVVRYTVIVELVVAAMLYLLWIPDFGWRGAFWPAVFHSVSAFCNAGFSTFSNSLIEFQRSPVVLLVISIAIVTGGLGFLTLEEVYRTLRSRRHGLRMSLHSRLVLITSGVLILGGWIAFAVLEWEHTLGHLPFVDRLANAGFLSVSARTAGFNSIETGEAIDATNFLTIILMMIGGSPGSTAGGVKTTTFALLGLLAWSHLKGDQTVSIFGRSLRKETTDRAIGLFVIAFGIVTLGILLLSITELGRSDGGFLDCMFETVSAFNTVGLSTGITPDLSTGGRFVTIVMMFVGRVGPLSVAAALARPAQGASRIRYAYEEVVVG